MSLVLILPDLHQDLESAEVMVSRGLEFSPDRVVFLGDLFDRGHDTPQMAADSARWFFKLKEFLGERLVALYGNHDIAYAEAARHLLSHGKLPDDYSPQNYCSGFEVEKARAIHEAVPEDFWESWKLHHREDGVLYTHAGASEGQERSLDMEADSAIAMIGVGLHPLLRVGPMRGGSAKDEPGILWRDFHEFADDAPCSQVFGHTRKDGVVRFTQRSVCLDTACASFALMRDARELQILSTRSKLIMAVKMPFDERYALTSLRHGNSRVRKGDVGGQPLGFGTDFTLPWPPVA